MNKNKLLLTLVFLLWTGVMTAQTGKNPLSIVAEYNLKADGTFEQAHSVQADYFKWSEVKNVQVPEGYHIPTKEELIVISGIYPPDEQTHTPYPDLSWKIDKTGDETVTLFGKTQTLSSHYYGEGKYVCYAIRFIGGDNKYLSAYKWEPVFSADDTDKTKIDGLKVTCRLLGNAGATLDVKELAKADYWSTNNNEDVERFFPAAGYGNYTKDGSVMDRNSRGRYWSITPRNEQETGAWGFGFDADFVMTYPWVATSHYCLRCFKNDTSGDEEANIAMEMNMDNLELSMNMAGPQNIEVDFGDGQRKKIDLIATQGVIEGTAIGSKVNIYAKEVTNFRASSLLIKSINFQGMEKLKTLELGFNKLNSLSLEGMPELEYLNAVSNRIESIDLTRCPKLKYLSLSKNFYISTLDFSNSKNIEQLYVATNALTNLNLDNLTNLKVLDVSGNSQINTLNLGKLTALEELFASKLGIANIDLSPNTNLKRLNLSENKGLASIKFNTLNNLQSCFLNKTALPKAQLDAFLAALPDVNNLKVYANERLWKKQLEVGGIAEVDNKLVDLNGAKVKGWLIDVFEESWTVGPKNPCLVLTTNIPVGQDITLNVENYYDPFWVDWGKWWSSFLQSKPYSIVHAVRQPEINYYSRGLMTLEAKNQKLAKVNLPNNDQTYAIDLSDNEMTEFVISKNNSLVTIDLRNNKLEADALNAFFENLRNLDEIKYPFETATQATFPENENFGKIFIKGNPGAEASNGYIAKQKGYKLDIEFTGIDSITTPGSKLSVARQSSGNVTLEGVAAGNMIQVFNLSGVLVDEARAQSSIETIDVSHLAPGMYLITCKGETVKLMVR